MDTNKKQKVNWITTFVLVFYPIILAALAIYYVNLYGIGSFEIVLFIITYYGANISVGVGFHRLWSHSAYKTNKYVEFVLTLLTAGTFQGPVLAWVSDHQRHHTFTDEEADPHSPLKYKNKFIGFLWSHIGWMLVKETNYKYIDKATMMRLGKNKVLTWQLKYYWQIASFMNLIVPPFIGYLCSGTLQGALAGYIFMGLARAFQQQVTFCVNSLCHVVGSKSYTDGTARDIWWMALFLLGENWHNFHHAFARDYRNGHKWYHFDAHKWIIAAMEKCGLAWDLVRTPQERIEAKKIETKRLTFSHFMFKLSEIEQNAYALAESARQKLIAAEKSTIELADNIQEKLKTIEESAKKLADKVKQLVKQPEIFEERIISQIMAKLKELENLAASIGIKHYATSA